MSKLPTVTVTRTIPLDPALAGYIEDKLSSLSGKQLEKAQAAVARVYANKTPATFDGWRERYDTAIAAALAS